MARAGISRGEVERARARILASGRHPSIDAIRIALGNTGSKATIHRYLKEIEDEEQGSGQTAKRSTSDEIQALIERLAERLAFESQERLTAAETALAEREAKLQATVHELRGQAEGLREELQREQKARAEEAEQRRRLQSEVVRLEVEKAQLAEKIGGLDERLVAAQGHIASLEQKHQHAREALEHFREAAKVQRDRELGQHEQQVQYLQSELAKVGALLTEKQHEARAALQDRLNTLDELKAARTEIRQLEERLRDVKLLQAELASQGRLVEQLRAQSDVQAVRFDELHKRCRELERRNRELESKAALAAATKQAREQLVVDLLDRLRTREANREEKLNGESGSGDACKQPEQRGG